MHEQVNGKKIVCRGVHGEREEVGVEKLSFRPSVYGVVIKDNAVLLSPQWDGYDIPGGGVDLGETLHDALKREVKEETGYDVEPGKVLLVENDFFIHPYSKKPLHTILIYYTCMIVGGALSDEGFDENEKLYAKKAEWVPLGKTGTLTFYNPVDTPSLIHEAAQASQ
jgi:8-oxo-dGTP diphosphatase